MNLFPQGAVAIIGVLLAYTSASAAVCSSVNSPTTIISTGCTDLVITDKNQASWTVEVSSGVNITQSTTSYSVLLGTVSGMSPDPTNLSAFTNNGSITSSKNDFTAFMLGTDATLGTLTNRGLIEGDAGIQKMGGLSQHWLLLEQFVARTFMEFLTLAADPLARLLIPAPSPGVGWVPWVLVLLTKFQAAPSRLLTMHRVEMDCSVARHL